MDPRDRYQIGSDDGLDRYCATKAEAFQRATLLARATVSAWVFDVMARRGRPEWWEVDAAGNARVVRVREDAPAA